MNNSVIPRLTGEQLLELEKRLVAAEEESSRTMKCGSAEVGTAQSNLHFHALEYIRRLLEDVKAYRPIADHKRANIIQQQITLLDAIDGLTKVADRIKSSREQW